MKQYLDLVRKVKEEGIIISPEAERTGTGTRSVYGEMMKFDLANGFPLVTTKKTFFRGVVEELLWFLRGETNSKTLESEGVNIWKEWAKEHGNCGPIYGASWRYYPHTGREVMIQVARRKDTFKDFKEPEIVWEPKIDCDLNCKYIWATGVLATSPNRVYRFQTHQGSVGTISRPRWRYLRNKETYGSLNKSVAGTGFLGNPKRTDERLYTLWYNMIRRCYDKNHPNYHLYGGSGITVSPIWHSYERFQETVASVPFFHLWYRNDTRVDLDKDYFGSKTYSPSTTIFMETRINQRIKSDSALEVKGELYSTWASFEEITGIRSDYIVAKLKEGKNSRGFSPSDVKRVKPENGYVWRPRLFIDQVENLIQEAKINPHSRRLVVSAWSTSQVSDQALPPCHAFWQISICGLGKVHLHLYQRSADIFLGVPFNIASYSLLLHMIAHHLDREPGTFIWTGHNCHLYNNHMTQVEELLQRTPLPLPTIKLNYDKNTPLWEVKAEDIELVGYQSHPAIKAPVAI